MTTRAEKIQALRNERELLVRRGRHDRVAQVDAQLARYDAKPEAPVLETAVPAPSQRAKRRA